MLSTFGMDQLAGELAVVLAFLFSLDDLLFELESLCRGPFSLSAHTVGNWFKLLLDMKDISMARGVWHRCSVTCS